MKDVESLLFLKGPLTSLRDILLGDWRARACPVGCRACLLVIIGFCGEFELEDGGKTDGMGSDGLMANRVRKIMTVKK